jgi:hypothetical protein
MSYNPIRDFKNGNSIAEKAIEENHPDAIWLYDCTNSHIYTYDSDSDLTDIIFAFESSNTGDEYEYYVSQDKKSITLDYAEGDDKYLDLKERIKYS